MAGLTLSQRVVGVLVCSHLCHRVRVEQKTLREREGERERRIERERERGRGRERGRKRERDLYTSSTTLWLNMLL